ncbi:MAG TPA: winged helix-turn-helix transcriptional regulator [Alphaproteobacteria bacterium]|nr:winged helix-turn-helix transcriptional regulator [Alphaproteobacteria bacterium]
MTLDLLDSKILAALDENARFTESEIGKRVRASKQVVKYRLERLENKKIIDNYYIMLDSGRLGFDSYYVFIQLTGLNSEEEKEIYKKICKLPNIAWLVTGVGRWDAALLFWSQNISEFNSQLVELKLLLGKHLHEYTFTTLIQAEHISYKFLKSESKNSLKTTSSKNRKFEFNQLDKKILHSLNHNARMPVTELSLAIKQPLHKVHYRLRQLQKENIIQGFKPKINVQTLGIQWHLVLISFNSVPQERIKNFISFCKSHKNVYYLTSTVGKYNIMLDIHAKNTQEFREFLFNIKDSFADVILLYESMLIFEELLITYVPGALMKLE